jgi:hypothetical protein
VRTKRREHAHSESSISDVLIIVSDKVFADLTRYLLKRMGETDKLFLYEEASLHRYQSLLGMAIHHFYLFLHILCALLATQAVTTKKPMRALLPQ